MVVLKPGLRAPRGRRGFSLIEMLIALTITATLLTATFTALDTSYRAYKITTEGASTNVIARMVMARTSTMIRTGEQFGPYPEDVLDPAQNPVVSTFIEFESFNDGAGNRRVIRLERRDQSDPQRGPYELWYVQTDVVSDVPGTPVERPLLAGVTGASFVLEYDVGPRLRRATVDITVKPNDYQDAGFHANLETPTIRLVTTVTPRRIDE
ncbi:MAG: prepilin-type N-terminal cleavage/methylation domain-containing protein [Planctomycetota bacterium]|nr:prepilin-type N-terminal cleavage/methylation domain-containing protein [Planctomycetota bacterium]